MSNFASPSSTLVSSSPIIDSTPFVVNLLPSQAYYKMDRQEDLASEGEYDYDDDMGDLSGVHNHAHVRTRCSASPPADTTPFSIAQKAERILGLTPGTLPHARAALENARDEVRRTAEMSAEDHAPVSYFPSDAAMASETGMRGRIDRAKKAMSVTFPSNTKVAGVVLGAGGKEEEKKRERRRRAADGVIYWQKEVARLEAESGPAAVESERQGTISKKARR